MALIPRDYHKVTPGASYTHGQLMMDLWVDLAEDVLCWEVTDITPGSVGQSPGGHDYPIPGAVVQTKYEWMDVITPRQARHDAELAALEAARDVFVDKLEDIGGNEEARQALYDYYDALYVAPVRNEPITPGDEEFTSVIAQPVMVDPWEDGL